MKTIKNLSGGTSGFTMLETVISITIMLTVSSCICIAFASGIKSVYKTNRSLSASVKILYTDYVIRKHIENTEFPYWENPGPLVLSARDSLWRSAVGKYIRDIQVVSASGRPGLRVQYVVSNEQVSTECYFCVYPLIEKSIFSP